MVLLLVEGRLGHEHREVGVLDTVSFEFGVGELLDVLPNEEGGRAQDVAPRDIVVFNQFRLGDHL